MGEWGETTHSNGCKRIRRSCFNVFMTPFPGSAEPSTEPTNTSRHDGIFHPYSTSSTSHFDSSLSTSRTSSISRSGSISRSDDDPLLGILPTAADADRPWLVWYSPDERIELTGHVLSMWAAKTAGLLSAEAGGRPRVHVALEPGWRALTWCLGTWLTGGRVLMGPAAPLGAAGADEPDASVADRPEALAPRAGVQVLVPRASLATGWDGELPPLVLDGVADVMPHPDAFAPVRTGADRTALTLLAGGGAVDSSRGELAAEAAASASAAAGARAVLVRVPDAAGAVRAVLAAWAGGATAVLLDAAAPDSLARTAARQEGAVALAPRPVAAAAGSPG